MVKAGRVRLSRCTVDGRELSIALVGPGDMVGEEAAFEAATYSTTAISCGAVAASSVSSDEARASLRSDPSAAFALMTVLRRRLDDAATMLEQLAFDRVQTRLMHVLERLALTDPDSEQRRFELELTHSDLASLVGSTRETVSSALAALGRARVIEFDGRFVTLLACPQSQWALPLDTLENRQAS